ncbi:replication-relaxation family protein [uncultured Tateyamaria sp.]|uniref:replication-relaxation family protein n=1 Tax=uncultured Tateyamaria sp. TaxID=455651 RepID=UPI0026303B85|nr:replication-relaxation family protein [uncultured Tateyamaria sp.]
MTTTTRTSQPRFQVPAEQPGIKLTDDDYQILWHIYRNRLIESSSLYQLFPGRSAQVISRRLKLLFRTEHIARPINQNVKNRLRPGTDPYVYAIARNGAAALRKKFAAQIPTSGWTYKNAQLSLTAIEHQLDTSRFVTNLIVAAQSRPDVRLLYADQLIPADVAEKRPAGLFNTVRADVSWPTPGRNEGTAPDIILGIEQEGRRQVLFVEIDRGTETIEPGKRKQRSERFWRDTSFLRKLLIYGAVFRTKAHQTQLGLPTFRVVTVVPNADRVESIKAAWHNHLSTGVNRTRPGLFLFTDWTSMSVAEDLLQVPFQNAAGRPVHLLDE